MVFFSCGACGEAVKKSNVERHINTVCRRSRNQVYMSCIDCSKDFWGEEYKAHLSCITEQEKYSGKGFKSKQEASKHQWISQVQRAAQKASSNHKLKSLLDQLIELPNVPKKKAKFQNFLTNNMHVRDMPLVYQAWDLIESERNKSTISESGESNPTENEEKMEQKSQKEEENGISEKSLSKREKKELRRQRQGKQEKKDKKTDENENNDEEEIPKKKKKKHRNNVDNEEEPVGKKRKRKRGEEDNLTGLGKEEIPNKKIRECSEDEDQDETEEKVVSEKFKWDAVIISALLKADDKTLSIKKLRKKVMSEYAARENGVGKSEEKLLAKFNKKISKNPKLKVLKDKVKLLQ